MSSAAWTSIDPAIPCSAFSCPVQQPLAQEEAEDHSEYVNAIATVKFAPLRNNERARATGAHEQDDEALERILSGREGGPFGQLSQFSGEYLGMERARVSLTDGDRPGLTVEGRTELSYQPLTGPDGGSTKIKNAVFGFAPEFEVGTTLVVPTPSD
jgi:hypothetical protein